MNRRQFLRAGAQATVLDAVASTNQTAPAAAASSKKERPTPAVLVSYAGEDHRRRLQNIALAERGVRTCLRKHLITDYLPGHCVYNLGAYPCRKPWNPDDWDDQKSTTISGSERAVAAAISCARKRKTIRPTPRPAWT